MLHLTMLSSSPFTASNRRIIVNTKLEGIRKELAVVSSDVSHLNWLRQRNPSHGEQYLSREFSWTRGIPDTKRQCCPLGREVSSRDQRNAQLLFRTTAPGPFHSKVCCLFVCLFVCSSLLLSVPHRSQATHRTHWRFLSPRPATIQVPRRL